MMKSPSRRRATLWALVVILIGAMTAPLAGYLYVGAVSAQEAEEATRDTPDNPRSEYWRAVREGQAGYSTAQDPAARTLIQNGGENWRQLRNGPLQVLGGWLLAAIVLAIGLFHLVKGPNRLEGELSGRRVPRWSAGERTLHWTTASLFVILAITGLSLLFGRAVLIPLLGHEGFAAWAIVAKWGHNLLGPVFFVCVLLMVLFWIRHNIPKRHDLEWFKKGGGMLGEHAPAGRMNGGEKAWFWFIATAGVIVCITGVVLDFPNIFQDRGLFQNAHLIHAGLALAWIGLFFGHAYIGTLGTEGALEGMVHGDVSEEWARQHHDLWLEELQQGGAAPRAPSLDAGTAREHPAG